ncbi:MAG: rRNA pseudouridine synthase [Kiritimatiellae bacterium]|nr:rRNA pseudouridine synthase [Kiritimatiellia bacterium]
MEDNELRLQKYISERGIVSRRKAAELICDGRVTVNGEVVTVPGTRVSADNIKVAIDGKDIEEKLPASRTIMIYKPRDYICSRSTEQGVTVYELLDKADRKLVTVGRLDKNSEGLLLLSNDGDLVNRLTHPSFDNVKIYKVTVSGNLNDVTLQTLQSRMIIDDYKIRPVKVTILPYKYKGNRFLLQFELKEGRNRQIRRMCDQVGLKIHRLVRTEFAGLTLGGLRAGEWKVVELTGC